MTMFTQSHPFQRSYSFSPLSSYSQEIAAAHDHQYKLASRLLAEREQKKLILEQRQRQAQAFAQLQHAQQRDEAIRVARYQQRLRVQLQQYQQQDQQLQQMELIQQRRIDQLNQLLLLTELEDHMQGRELYSEDVKEEAVAEKVSPTPVYYLCRQPVSSPPVPTLSTPVTLVSSVTAPVSSAINNNTTADQEQLQQQYQSHLHRRQKLTTLASLTSLFNSHRSTFQLPSHLIFSTPSTSSHASNNEAHKLAFSTANAPFLAYEDFLVGLLSQVDAIESEGDQLVIEARKELVRKIEIELKGLDEARETSWNEQNVIHEAVELAATAIQSGGAAEEVQNLAQFDATPSLATSATPLAGTPIDAAVTNGLTYAGNVESETTLDQENDFILSDSEDKGNKSAVSDLVERGIEVTSESRDGAQIEESEFVVVC